MEIQKMKRLICALAAAMSLNAITLYAAEITIEKKEGAPIKAEYVSADANGDITYKQEKFTGKIKANDYKFARIAKIPDEITAADKKFADRKYQEALADYRNLYNLYRHVGFDVYCIYRESACLDKLGKKEEALARLKILDTCKNQDPQKKSDLSESEKLQANLLIKLDKFDEANKVLSELGNSDDDNLAAFSFNARGDILLKQGKKKEAVLKYMIPALIFNAQNKERPRALCQVANILKELGDNRATKFSDMLKKDYPDSPFIRELK
jgi:tetratricopeptide (TPR) repeat protein